MSLNAIDNDGDHPRPKQRVAQRTIVLLGLAAVALVLLGTSRFGAGVSPDSAAYLSAAKSLLAGNGYVYFDDLPFAGWPPLFPTLLAALGLTGVEPAAAARWVNALAMGAIVIASGMLLARCIQSQAMIAIGTLSVVCALPLLNVSIMAWTEPLFVLLIVLFLRQMTAFLHRRTVSALVRAALLAALCALQRYTGVAVIVTGALVVLLPLSKVKAANRLKHLAGYSLLSCGPLAVWAVRNHLLTGMLTGHARTPSRYPLGENITTALDTMTAWLWPATTALSIRVTIAGGILLLIAIAFLLDRVKLEGPTHQATLDLLPAGLFILVYLPFMTYSHQVGVYDERMNDRYLVPVFVPALWFVFIGLDRARVLLASVLKTRRWPELIVAGGCALWLCYPLTRSHERISSWMRDGTGGYSTPAWNQSELVNWLRDRPLEGKVYSNLPGALCFLTGIQATASPHRSWDLATFQEAISTTPTASHLVWFRHVRVGYAYEIEELTSALYLERCATLSDGQVYRLLPATDRSDLQGPLFSTRQVNGTWCRSFRSDTFGQTGLIRSWLLHADGTTESAWELKTDERTVLSWHPHGRYTHSEGAFEFSCEGEAHESGSRTAQPYVFHVEGTLGDHVATGTYQLESTSASGPAVDRGTWRVDLARPVYRLWSSVHDTHFYTIRREEANQLTDQHADGWVRERIAFCAYPPGREPPDAQPVYRLRSRASGKRFCTMQPRERARLLSDPTGVWEDEGIAFYAYAEDNRPAEARPVHRFWARLAGGHVYTMDETERAKLATQYANAWTYEGVAWYALPSPR